MRFKMETLSSLEGVEMGRCAVVSPHESGWLCGTGSALLRLKKGLLPHFVQMFISSSEGRTYLSEGSVGYTMDNLNQKVFAAMPISLPPLEEQQEIIRRVEALFKLADAIEQRVAAASLRAERLTQAVLAKAFRGELVPTEAELARREGRTYEPASVLLERIKAERAKISENGTGERRGPGNESITAVPGALVDENFSRRIGEKGFRFPPCPPNPSHLPGSKSIKRWRALCWPK
jgi:hypothetical protein